MMHKILISCLAFLLASCSGLPTKPKVSLYSIEDTNYPCTKVSFPEQIRFDGQSKIETKTEIAIVQYVLMPGYNVEITKLYSKDKNMSIESLASLYDDKSKVYEINDTEEFPDKSAVITITEDKDGIYLKGSVAEYLQNDIAIRVDITRPIKRSGLFARDSIEKWRNSTTGNRNIANMREIVDYLFANISTIECVYKNTIDLERFKD